MKRQTAFNGFFKNLKAQQAQMRRVEAGEIQHCQIASEMKDYQMRIKKYVNSLVLEHNYQDVHTKKYLEVR